MYLIKKVCRLLLCLAIIVGALNFQPIGKAFANATSNIVVSDSQLNIGETSLVTITFSEVVTGFTPANLTVKNGTLAGLITSDSKIWTATLTPTMGITETTNVITLYNTGIQDLLGGAVSGTDSNNYAIDTVRPTATIIMADTALSSGDTSLVTITFTEAVTGFTNADLTVPNGTLSTVSSNDGGITWTATFTPTVGVTDATNVITLNNTGVADLAGNVGTGTTDSNNYTIDTVIPTATIVVAHNALTLGETSTVTITFSEAVTGLDYGDFTVTNGTLAGLSSSDGGITWTATFTPTVGVTDATNVITLDNTGVADLAGNVGTGTTDSNNYIIDTSGPTATIVVADNALNIGETSLVTITFSEAVSGFDKADLTVPNGTLSAVSTGDGRITWTATFTPTAGITDATNVITLDLDNSGVQNASGNAGIGTTNSNNYAIDTVRPTSIITVSDNALIIGETSTVTITFSEAVTGFTNTDLTVENGTLSAISSSDGGITWTATFTPTAGITDATNVITLNNTGVTDLAGNVGTGTTDSSNYTIDTVRPTATIVVADNALSIGETSSVTITFSEAVSGFTIADLTVPNGTLSAVSSSDGGITWTATITPTAGITDATNVITLNNTGVTDLAGNVGTGTTDSSNYTIDTVRPTATIVVADNALSIGETSSVTITFSEAVTGFTNADLTVPNGTLSAVSSSDGGFTWTATLTPEVGISTTGDKITLDNTGVADMAGNVGQGSTTSNLYDVNTMPAPSSDLSSLELSSGTLSPIFSSVTTAYTSNVAYSVSGLTVTPSVKNSSATIKVNGISVNSGQSSANIPLSAGVNTITVVVTAEDNSTSTYTITVIRENDTSSGGGGGSSPITTTPSTNDTVISTDGKLTLPVGKSGKVSFADEVIISIPTGSSLQELILNITKVLNTDNLLTNKEVLASSVFKIQTNISESFSKRVTLNLLFEPTTVKSNQTVAVFYYNDVKKEWMYIDGGKIQGNHITVETDYVGMVAVFVVDQATGKPATEQVTDIISEAKFNDISRHWAEVNIKQAVNSGIVKGYPDGTFKPSSTVTRAEFSVMLMNALNSQDSQKEISELTFTDRSKIGAWAQTAIAQAVQSGIIHGYQDGTFRPNAMMTRSEMVVMIGNAVNLTMGANPSTDFLDDQDIPSWAQGAVEAMKKQGLIEGTDTNEFHPNAQTTRAEAVTILLRTLAQMSK